MAGSLNHIVDHNGEFYMDSIENMSDAHEALDECFHILKELIEGDWERLNPVLKKLRYPQLDMAAKRRYVEENPEEFEE